MGWPATLEGHVTELLFDETDLPEIIRPTGPNFTSLRYPVWTENKAKLIKEYIRLFTYVTKHGIYIDGFAAPQRREKKEICSAKLVLDTEPKRIRKFWLCDIDPNGIEILNEIKNESEAKSRTINVLEGDFNKTINQVLASGDVTEKTATFALLDQRTFECQWDTVRRISEFKKDRKIEIFYFFATGWIDRSIKAVSTPETKQKVERWWGKPDWENLCGMDSTERAYLLTDRFKKELGYEFAHPFAIHNHFRGGRTMYHMIHATDHSDAPPLMLRAYRKVSGRLDTEILGHQDDFQQLWQETAI